MNKWFPVVDPVATGKRIEKYRKKRNLSVREVQEFFGFESPQAIYQWQQGKTLPSVDNLCALSRLLEVPMDNIVVMSEEASRVLPEKKASSTQKIWKASFRW